MNPFEKLPGHRRSAPGRERQLWRRLPAVLLWGTALPLAFVRLRLWANRSAALRRGAPVLRTPDNEGRS